MKKEQFKKSAEQIIDKFEKTNSALFYMSNILLSNDIDITKKFVISSQDLANMCVEDILDLKLESNKQDAFEFYRAMFKDSFPVIKWTDNRNVIWDVSEIDYKKSVNYLNN